ncbi:MAG TPA: cache domain-containing protein [Herpetosiphonaceae bacterium]
MSSRNQNGIVPAALRVSRRQSLQWYLLVLLGITLLVTLIVVGLGVYRLIARTEQRLWQARQGETAANAAANVAGFLEHTQNTLNMIGVLDRRYLEESPGVLQAILAQNPLLEEVVRVDGRGNIFAAASQDKPLLSTQITVGQSTWFVTARSGGHYLGDIQISAADEPYLIMAMPTPGGGAVAARLRMNLLWDTVKQIHFGQTGTIYVVNQAGQIVAHTDRQIVLANTRLAVDSPLIAPSPSSDPVEQGRYINFQGAPVVGVTAQLPQTDWKVVIEVPQSEASAVRTTTLGALSGGMLVFGLLVMATTTLLLVQRVFRPLAQLRLGAERIGHGDLGSRIAIGRQDEIGQLATAFNTMAAAVQERESALQQLTTSLEQQVEERTAQLRQQNETQAQLQERVIRLQATALAELSTPLIPITDEILAMPLIGATDSRRAQQLLQTLLRGVEERRAQVAILDITGVPVIDTQVANTLLQVARAVRMLGAEFVLTGIRPEVAQTLVGLGVDLSTMTTHADLQRGIAYAVRHLRPASGAAV